MPTIARSQLAFYLLAGLAVVVLGIRAVRAAAPPAPDPARQARAAPARTIRIERPAAELVVVHVVGAVRRPGVYRLPATARVAEVVRRAGGARATAELAAVNLAARVADGQQIVVPGRAAAAAPAASTGAAGVAAAAPSPAAPVDLNTATAEQLDQLDGVGPVTAQKILAWRREHGAFRSSDELGQIPGIGPKRLAALRPQVRP